MPGTRPGTNEQGKMNHLNESVRCVGIGLVGDEIEDEYFHDAISSAAMRLARRPGNAKNPVATAAISANRQADKKT
jgi:hypothetical protein